MKSAKELKFVDLCAGIGGFRRAMESLGNTRCTLTCEIDKFAAQTYKANFPAHETSTMHRWESDIRQIDASQLEDFDVLCAGFPCQAFSLAGRQGGFSDTRGTIFFDIGRIVRHKRPGGLLMENVKNLLSHDKGNTFRTIEATLDDLGYWHAHYLINAQHFVAQKRTRLYIVALNKDEFSQAHFQALCADIEKCYKAVQCRAPCRFEDILESDVPDKYTLSDKLWNYLQAHAHKHTLWGNGFGFGLMKKGDITARTLTARYYKDGAEVLVEQEGKNPRRLTPREAARLMGYPDDYQIVVSNTQAYKQFGNSVVVPVIEMLAQCLHRTLRPQGALTPSKQ